MNCKPDSYWCLCYDLLMCYQESMKRCPFFPTSWHHLFHTNLFKPGEKDFYWYVIALIASALVPSGPGAFRFLTYQVSFWQAFCSVCVANVGHKWPWICTLKSLSRAQAWTWVIWKTGCCPRSRSPPPPHPPAPHHSCNPREGKSPYSVAPVPLQELPERCWSQQWTALGIPALDFSWGYTPKAFPETGYGCKAEVWNQVFSFP